MIYRHNLHVTGISTLTFEKLCSTLNTEAQPTHLVGTAASLLPSTCLCTRISRLLSYSWCLLPLHVATARWLLNVKDVHGRGQSLLSGHVREHPFSSGGNWERTKAIMGVAGLGPTCHIRCSGGDWDAPSPHRDSCLANSTRLDLTITSSSNSRTHRFIIDPE